jgi:hypothetical protein
MGPIAGAPWQALLAWVRQRPGASPSGQNMAAVRVRSHAAPFFAWSVRFITQQVRALGSIMHVWCREEDGDGRAGQE